MLDYPAKILMALAMTFEENGDQFRQWLIDNSYPELAALSDAIKGSKNARKWLMDNKYYHLAAFDAVLDDDENARKWLQEFNFPILVVLADAVNQDIKSIKWLAEHNLDIYIILSQKIKQIAGYFLRFSIPNDTNSKLQPRVERKVQKRFPFLHRIHHRP